MRRLCVLLALLFLCSLPAVVTAQERPAVVKTQSLTLDAKMLGAKKPVTVIVDNASIAAALQKSKYRTVAALAKADLGKLTALLAKTQGHKASAKSKPTTLARIHPKAAHELAARLKATANEVVMSGGSTMLKDLKGGTAVNVSVVGRVFLNPSRTYLNPSRTYKQKPDKF